MNGEKRSTACPPVATIFSPRSCTPCRMSPARHWASHTSARVPVCARRSSTRPSSIDWNCRSSWRNERVAASRSSHQYASPSAGWVTTPAVAGKASILRWWPVCRMCIPGSAISRPMDLSWRSCARARPKHRSTASCRSACVSGRHWNRHSINGWARRCRNPFCIPCSAARPRLRTTSSKAGATLRWLRVTPRTGCLIWFVTTRFLNCRRISPMCVICMSGVGVSLMPMPMPFWRIFPSSKGCE
ncbi:hypothetical protein D3C84_709990 [compost metagenome]